MKTVLGLNSSRAMPTRIFLHRRDNKDIEFFKFEDEPTFGGIDPMISGSGTSSDSQVPLMMNPKNFIKASMAQYLTDSWDWIENTCAGRFTTRRYGTYVLQAIIVFAKCTRMEKDNASGDGVNVEKIRSGIWLIFCPDIRLFFPFIAPILLF